MTTSIQSPFRILYRQYLFRVVDLEALSGSARGDASKLLGQFAALLIYASALLALSGLLSDGRRIAPPQRLAVEHFLIATTMLVVGLFAVLSWDSALPDRRDLLVLAALPVRKTTLFLAKIAAQATALALAVVVFHCLAGLVWPIVLAPPRAGMLGIVRSFAAYWITFLSAATFVSSSLLCLQGLVALLPRQSFLRASPLLQLTAFCLLVGVYFLEPTIVTPAALAAPRNQHLLAWLPSYWFLGLFEWLNGTVPPRLVWLALRATGALVVTVATATTAFLLSYFWTLPRILEQPNLTPGVCGGCRLPDFGERPITALVQFSIRTLFRQPQHRLIFSFYFGLAFAIVILYVKTPLAQSGLMESLEANPWHQVNAPLLVSSIVMMWFAVIGTRVAFAMPADLPANWIFRIVSLAGPPDCMKAIRRSMFFIAVAPVWMMWAGVLFWLWPWWPAVAHLIVLGFLGVILVEACLYNFHKIPFACSYLPGKANVYYLFFVYAILSIYLLDRAASLEKSAIQSRTQYAALLLALAILAGLMRWRAMVQSRSEGSMLRFEEEETSAVLELGLR